MIMTAFLWILWNNMKSYSQNLIGCLIQTSQMNKLAPRGRFSCPWKTEMIRMRPGVLNLKGAEIDMWWLILSIWPTGHRVPRGAQILCSTLFWLCLWGCFWMRVTFFYFVFVLGFFWGGRGTPTACGSSWAKNWIQATEVTMLDP